MKAPLDWYKEFFTKLQNDEETDYTAEEIYNNFKEYYELSEEAAQLDLIKLIKSLQNKASQLVVELLTKLAADHKIINIPLKRLNKIINNSDIQNTLNNINKDLYNERLDAIANKIIEETQDNQQLQLLEMQWQEAMQQTEQLPKTANNFLSSVSKIYNNVETIIKNSETYKEYNKEVPINELILTLYEQIANRKNNRRELTFTNNVLRQHISDIFDGASNFSRCNRQDLHESVFHKNPAIVVSTQSQQLGYCIESFCNSAFSYVNAQGRTEPAIGTAKTPHYKIVADYFSSLNVKSKTYWQSLKQLFKEQKLKLVGNIDKIIDYIIENPNSITHFIKERKNKGVYTRINFQNEILSSDEYLDRLLNANEPAIMNALFSNEKIEAVIIKRFERILDESETNTSNIYYQLTSIRRFFIENNYSVKNINDLHDKFLAKLNHALQAEPTDSAIFKNSLLQVSSILEFELSEEIRSVLNKAAKQAIKRCGAADHLSINDLAKSFHSEESENIYKQTSSGSGMASTASSASDGIEESPLQQAKPAKASKAKRILTNILAKFGFWHKKRLKGEKTVNKQQTPWLRS